MNILKKLAFLSVISVLLFACSSSPENEAKSKINELESNLFSSEDMVLNRKQASELVNAYIDYADKFPDDTLSPEYIFKAADICMNILNPSKAIWFFDRIIREYPDYRKVPESMFLKAYVYDNNMQSYDLARKLYTEFIEKYPDNEFADDARVSIQNLGKTPEEIIKEIEERAKAQQEEK
ncbi:MAG: tetratricopeptide repeat protein [Bacteroidales bacterium]|nr:tetratricopeptide repeat protein [Bacteroidales bacterium]